MLLAVRCGTGRRKGAVGATERLFRYCLRVRVHCWLRLDAVPAYCTSPTSDAVPAPSSRHHHNHPRPPAGNGAPGRWKSAWASRRLPLHHLCPRLSPLALPLRSQPAAAAAVLQPQLQPRPRQANRVPQSLRTQGRRRQPAARTLKLGRQARMHSLMQQPYSARALLI